MDAAGLGDLSYREDETAFGDRTVALPQNAAAIEAPLAFMGLSRTGNFVQLFADPGLGIARAVRPAPRIELDEFGDLRSGLREGRWITAEFDKAAVPIGQAQSAVEHGEPIVEQVETGLDEFADGVPGCAGR